MARSIFGSILCFNYYEVDFAHYKEVIYLTYLHVPNFFYYVLKNKMSNITEHHSKLKIDDPYILDAIKISKKSKGKRSFVYMSIGNSSLSSDTLIVFVFGDFWNPLVFLMNPFWMFWGMSHLGGVLDIGEFLRFIKTDLS